MNPNPTNQMALFRTRQKSRIQRSNKHPFSNNNNLFKLLLRCIGQRKHLTDQQDRFFIIATLEQSPCFGLLNQLHLP
jgi:hypothetical protein